MGGENFIRREVLDVFLSKPDVIGSGEVENVGEEISVDMETESIELLKSEKLAFFCDDDVSFLVVKPRPGIFERNSLTNRFAIMPFRSFRLCDLLWRFRIVVGSIIENDLARSDPDRCPREATCKSERIDDENEPLSSVSSRNDSLVSKITPLVRFVLPAARMRIDGLGVYLGCLPC